MQTKDTRYCHSLQSLDKERLWEFSQQVVLQVQHLQGNVFYKGWKALQTVVPHHQLPKAQAAEDPGKTQGFLYQLGSLLFTSTEWER